MRGPSEVSEVLAGASLAGRSALALNALLGFTGVAWHLLETESITCGTATFDGLISVNSPDQRTVVLDLSSRGSEFIDSSSQQ